MASADDLEREPWRAAVLHQRGGLMPVDLIGDGRLTVELLAGTSRCLSYR